MVRRWGPGMLAAAAIVAGVPGTATAQYGTYVWAPEVYYGLGAGAEFIGNNSDLDVCAQTSADPTFDNCQKVTELAGGGMSLFLGLRPSEYFGIELTYDVFFHQGEDQDPYNLATLQSLRADARLFFLPGAMIDPYVRAGGGLYFIGDEYDYAAVGGGFQLGAGLDLYLDPVVSLGADVSYRGVYFGTFDISRNDLPWASSNGAVKDGFLHNVAVLLNLTVHSIY